MSTIRAKITWRHQPAHSGEQPPHGRVGNDERHAHAALLRHIPHALFVGSHGLTLARRRQQHRCHNHDDQRLCPGQALIKQPVLNFGGQRPKAPGQPVDTAARRAAQGSARWLPFLVAAGAFLFEGHGRSRLVDRSCMPVKTVLRPLRSVNLGCPV